MSQLYSNNAVTALAAAATASATTLTVANGAVLPALTAGDHFLVTLIGLNANGAETKWEIVKVTARSSNTLTVVRGQEGTTAQAWANGTLVEARLTAGTLANLVEKVAGKQLSTEDFTSALLAKLNAAAPLASPAFTGNPTAPTPAVADNDTSIATTAFVKAALAALVDASPAALDTLNELAAALGGDPNFATTMATELGKKLDATSYTAADVLAKLKTVDGAGSGLDADLLDGQDSAFYRSASNLNAGTVPDAQLPARLGGVAATISDWDAALDNGWYMGSDAANAPKVGAVWFLGSVEAHGAAGYRTQTVHGFTSDGASDTKTWRRDQNGGAWGSWYRLRLSEAEQSALYLRKVGDTLTGKLTTAAPAAGSAGLGLPHGATPTTLANGDMWTTTSGMYVYINGVTRDLYHSGNLADVSQAEAQAGTATARRAWTAQRVHQAVGGANAASATKLQTPRTINGIPFDGTADITVSADPSLAVLHATALLF